MDEKKPQVEADDVIMQYPSPSDGPDAQYYHLPLREQEMAQQVEQEGSHQGLPALQDHQEPHEQHQEEEHHDLHELQELQDPPPPDQDHPTASHADDLQLAAQLTQGLAPIISAVHSQEQEQQLHAEDTDMQNQGDANLHEQLQAQLQSHDQMQGHDQMQTHEQMQGHEQIQGHEQMQSHDQMQAHDQMQNHDQLQSHDQLQNHEQLQNHDQLQNHEQMQSREHELQEVLSHVDQAQVHPHYVQTTQQPQHMQSHTPIDGLPHPQYPLVDNTPPRKRSKVSRACDECRRKKIKCDAQSEPGGQPCSNCRRASAQCLFSRVPQKRGPSKGYIKELADRINNIEGKFGISKEDSAARRTSAEAYASPTPGDDGRKRPFSNISVDGFSAPSPSRQTPWGAPEHKLIRPYQPEYRPQYSANDLAPKPEDPAPNFPGPIDGLPQVRQDGGMEGITQNGLVQGDIPVDGLPQDDLSQDQLHQVDQLRYIEDATFDCYLNVIHRTFPVLASSKLRVQSMLDPCPATLRSAFFNAFYALVNPFISNDSSQDLGDSLAANQLLCEWEAERHPRSAVSDLVYFQTLVMMVIEADHHGLESVNGQAAGPSKMSTLARAVGVGYSMKLHLAQLEPNPNLAELDPDSENNVAVRAWWTLVMLDRWNAIGTASPTIVSNNSVVILPGLKFIVSDVVLLFIKLSYFLGHFNPLALRPSADPYAGSPPILGSFNDAVAESFRWQFPDELDEASEPGLHLAYWHFRLLGQIFSTPNLDFVLQICQNLIRLLTRNPQLLNPLTHHFICLSSLVVLELAKVDNHREEATKLAKHMIDFGVAPSPWNEAVRDKLAEKTTAPRPSTSSALHSHTLHQLADLATAVEEGTSNPEPTPQQNHPYLQAEAPISTLPMPSAPGPVTTDTLKEDLLNSIKDLNEDHPMPPPPQINASPTQNNAHNNLGIEAEPEQKFDLQAIIRSGYLTCFDANIGNIEEAVSISTPS